jgi:hypothetical protein
MTTIADTPAPPYLAVIFTSVRSDLDPDGYRDMAVGMLDRAAVAGRHRGRFRVTRPVSDCL